MKSKNNWIVIAIVVLVAACKLPSFSFKQGGKSNEELPGKSIQVDFFENQAALASSNASINLTEGLRDLVLSQSKKELVADKGDWHITGTITQYQVSPINIQAGNDNAQQNRLSMTVKVNCELNDMVLRDGAMEKRDSLVLDESGDGRFSAFVDFDATQNFASLEDELLTELIRQITQDIYDKIFGGKW